MDALDLLRAQSELEVGPGVTLSGPETDTEILPAAMFSEILPKWKVLISPNAFYLRVLDALAPKRRVHGDAG